MSQEQSPETAPTARRLQRSRSNRMIAGVAGGLAEYTDLDPLLVRVLLAVLTVFGGVGALLYVVGWLLLPAADQQWSPAEAALRRGRHTGAGTGSAGGSLAVVAGLLVVLGGLAVVAGQSGTANLILLGLTLIGGVLLHRHLRRGEPTSTSTAAPTTAAPPDPARAVDTVPLLSGPPETYPGGGFPGDVATRSMAAVNQQAERLAAAALADDDRAMHGPWPAPAEPTVPVRTGRWPTGVIGVAAALAALGVVLAVDRTAGLGLGPEMFAATALAVVGLALVVGAFLGRARWLILLGLPLTAVVLAASLVPWQRHGGVGDQQWRPTAVAEIAAHYGQNVGGVRLDLRRVRFADRVVRTSIEVGAGRVEVVVPRSVDVTVHSRARLGDLAIFDTDSGGAVSRTERNNGPDGPGGGRLDLTVEVGVGQVEVSRA